MLSISAMVSFRSCGSINPYLYIDPVLHECMGFLQHAVGFAHTRAHAYIYLELSPLRSFL